MSVGAVGSSQTQYDFYNSDGDFDNKIKPGLPKDKAEPDGADQTEGKEKTKGADQTEGKEKTEGADQTEGTEKADGADKSKGTEKANGADKDTTPPAPDNSKNKSDDLAAPSSTKLSDTKCLISDMSSVMTTLVAILSQIKRDNAKASFAAQMANVTSLQADAQTIKDNAKKQRDMAIATAVLTGVGQMTAAFSNIMSGCNKVKGATDLVAHPDSAEFKAAFELKSGVADKWKGSGEFVSGSMSLVTGIIDASAKYEQSLVDGKLKESEALRSQNDAYLKMVENSSNGIKEAIDRGISALNSVYEQEAQTRRSILG